MKIERLLIVGTNLVQWTGSGKNVVVNEFHLHNKRREISICLFSFYLCLKLYCKWDIFLINVSEFWITWCTVTSHLLIQVKLYLHHIYIILYCIWDRYLIIGSAFGKKKKRCIVSWYFWPFLHHITGLIFDLEVSFWKKHDIHLHHISRPWIWQVKLHDIHISLHFILYINLNCIWDKFLITGSAFEITWCCVIFTGHSYDTS